MKKLNEILQEFDGIQELPVSEEFIGAYIEGKLAGADLREVQNILNSNTDLFQMVDSLRDTDFMTDNLVYPSQSGIEIPSVLNDHNTKTSIDDYLDVLNDNSFTVENGECIFNIDFEQFDIKELLDFPSDNHKSMTRDDSNDFSHLDNTNNEVFN